MAERDFYDWSLTLRVLHTVHFDPNRASKSAFLRKTLIISELLKLNRNEMHHDICLSFFSPYLLFSL